MNARHKAIWFQYLSLLAVTAMSCVIFYYDEFCWFSVASSALILAQLCVVIYTHRNLK